MYIWAVLTAKTAVVLRKAAMRVDDNGVWFSANDVRALFLTCCFAALLAFTTVTVVLDRYLAYLISIAVGVLALGLPLNVPRKVQITRGGRSVKKSRFAVALLVSACLVRIIHEVRA
jgi:hypothetical protein